MQLQVIQKENKFVSADFGIHTPAMEQVCKQMTDLTRWALRCVQKALGHPASWKEAILC